MKYRTDIDGLRGLAVIAVLLFHVGFFVPGGFIGVDVFFVISGFLITGILLSSAENNQLNIFDFYKRRVVRLYPALCVTLLLTLLAGYLILEPNLLIDLAKSAVRAAVSTSNFYFSKNGGYFAANSDFKPLLHTWSLGVEQQFYIIWPFIIFYGMKKGRNTLFAALSLITIVSLILSQHAVTQGSDGAYFKTQFRVFELSLGGLLAFITSRKTSPLVDELLCVLGLGLIISSIFVFDKQTPFPGINALLPCAGAMLCIYAGSARYSGILLRNKIIVFVGTISYSLYLIHWPVIAFYKYHLFVPPTVADQLTMLVISITLAVPMYYFCEHICQNINKVRGNSVKPIAMTLISVVIVVACSKLIINDSGLPWRLDEKYQPFVTDTPDFHEKYYGGTGYSSDRVLGESDTKIIVAGDSFANQLMSGMDKHLSDKIEIKGEFAHGCIFGEGVTRMMDNKPREICTQSYERMKLLLNGNNKPLVLSFSWNGYEEMTAKTTGEIIKFKDKKQYYSFMYDNLKTIRSSIGYERKMIVIGVPPFNDNHPGLAISSCLFRPGYINSTCKKSEQFVLNKSPSNDINRYLSEFAQNHSNTYFIEPSDALCQNGVCSDVIDDKIVYSDAAHLSKEGSAILINHFKDKIMQIIDLKPHIE